MSKPTLLYPDPCSATLKGLFLFNFYNTYQLHPIELRCPMQSLSVPTLIPALLYIYPCKCHIEGIFLLNFFKLHPMGHQCPVQSLCVPVQTDVYTRITSCYPFNSCSKTTLRPLWVPRAPYRPYVCLRRPTSIPVPRPQRLQPTQPEHRPTEDPNKPPPHYPPIPSRARPRPTPPVSPKLGQHVSRAKIIQFFCLYRRSTFSLYYASFFPRTL